MVIVELQSATIGLAVVHYDARRKTRKMAKPRAPTKYQCEVLKGCREGRTFEDFSASGPAAGRLSVTMISLQRRGWLVGGRLTAAGLSALERCSRNRAGA